MTWTSSIIVTRAKNTKLLPYLCIFGGLVHNAQNINKHIQWKLKDQFVLVND